MKKIILILAAVASLSSCSNDNGRYEVISHGGMTLLIDSREGEIWWFRGRKAGWINIGTPPESAPNDGDRLNVFKQEQ